MVTTVPKREHRRRIFVVWPDNESINMPRCLEVSTFFANVGLGRARLKSCRCARKLQYPREHGSQGKTAILIAIFFAHLAAAQTHDLRLPPEVKFKSGYVNSQGRPEGFDSAMLWGIAIADTRVPGFESATVQIAKTKLTCRVDGKDVVLNDDRGKIKGGLYRRHPWFGTDEHEPMPMESEKDAVVMRVGTRPDKVWHFWAGSPRAEIPAGKFEGCTVHMRARISKGALLQIGMDYWRDTTVGYGSGGNNHEAGASGWYFASSDWQEAVFTDVHH